MKSQEWKGNPPETFTFYESFFLFFNVRIIKRRQETSQMSMFSEVTMKVSKQCCETTSNCLQSCKLSVQLTVRNRYGAQHEFISTCDLWPVQCAPRPRPVLAWGRPMLMNGWSGLIFACTAHIHYSCANVAMFSEIHINTHIKKIVPYVKNVVRLQGKIGHDVQILTDGCMTFLFTPGGASLLVIPDTWLPLP